MSIRTLRAAIAAVAGIVAAVALGGTAPTPAHASSTYITLPLTALGDVAATAQHVFVSGGADSTEIVVTDPDGQLTDTITGLQGPTSLAVTPNGNRLYVALPAANAIVGFDARTFDRTAWFYTGANTCPSEISVVGNRLWFGYGCGTDQGDIGMIELTPLRVRVHLGLLPQPASPRPLLAVSADRPSRVVVASGSDLASYAVGTGGRLTPVSAGPSPWSRIAALSISRDGSLVYVMGASSAAACSYRTDDLTAQVRCYYAAMKYGTGVALSPNGQYLATASRMKTLAISVYVFNQSDATVIDYDNTAVTQFGRLVWSPDGSRIYLATQDIYHAQGVQPPRLYVVQPVLP